ncbi:MAG: ABC transporter permease [Actinomycetia bacterium]|nr:ABC transporter permease [Actinomycetes bacterium]
MKAYLTSILRSAWTYKLRLLAIATIVFLGSGIFAGLLAVSPNMKTGGDRYYDGHNIYDLHLRSTFGFNADDVAAIRATEGVERVQTADLFDAVATIGGRDYTVQLNSLDTSASARAKATMNQLTLTEGRWPQAEDEVVLIKPALGTTQTIRLGGSIRLKTKDGDGTSDILKRTDFKLVGYATTPQYLFFFLGGTNKGSGSLDYEIFVPQENFKLTDTVTDVFATVKGARALNTYSNAYVARVKVVQDRLSALAAERAKLPWQKAQDAIAEAKRTLAGKRTDADAAFADAQRKLDDSQQQLDSGQAALAVRQQQYTSGKAALAAGQQQLAQQRVSGQARLDAARAQAAVQLAAAQAQLDQLEQLLSVTPTSTPEYAVLQAQLEQGRAALAAHQQTSAAQLAAAQTQLDSQLAAASARLAASQRQLDAAPAQLAAAQRQLDAARAQLEQGRATLADKRASAATSFADAQDKIDDSIQQLADRGEPQWFVLARSDDFGFASFQADTDAMKNLATIFPALFILVAALVSLTTMTRMVDEDRLVIGTYQSLGYNKLTISAKYLSYALILGVAGASIGAVFGMWLYPTIIWNTYAHLFTLPRLVVSRYPVYVLSSVVILTATITLATGVALIATLRESSATLMLPKAPHPGKRTFLEHVGPLWRRLTFMQKVTVRNIFLNTRRMLMTVIGIAGCTALLLIGWGLHGSISSTIDRQMAQIFRYNISVGFSGKLPSTELRALMADHRYFADSALGMRVTALVALPKGQGAGAKIDVENGVYLTSFEHASEGARLINFLDPATGRRLPFTDDSVFVNQKLAEVMNLRVGSRLEVTPQMAGTHATHTVIITGIVRNYTSNYLYLGPRAYKRFFGTAPPFNQILARSAQLPVDKDLMQKQLDPVGDVTNVTYVDDTLTRIGQMTANLNSVMTVLIAAAAALAFVVLYTLTDVNIAERKREIATLEVLGFYPGETNGYIFREVFGLVFIGAVLGLGLGQFLFQVVLTSVEPSGFRFVRTLSPVSYLLAVAFTLIFAVLVNLAMIPKIQGVDMLESLKSVE